MTEGFTAACVQLTSGREPEDNAAAASRLIREARAAGADLIMTPETTNMIEPRRRLALEKAQAESEHIALAALRGLTAELGCWLLIGSLVTRVSDERLANRSLLIDPQGAIAARYDKIHMFDVEVPDGQTYRESKAYNPGKQAVTADLPWGRLGLSVCYDLRFPHLYRSLAKAEGTLRKSAPALARLR